MNQAHVEFREGQMNKQVVLEAAVDYHCFGVKRTVRIILDQETGVVAIHGAAKVQVEIPFCTSSGMQEPDDAFITHIDEDTVNGEVTVTAAISRRGNPWYGRVHHDLHSGTPKIMAMSVLRDCGDGDQPGIHVFAGSPMSHERMHSLGFQPFNQEVVGADVRT